MTAACVGVPLDWHSPADYPRAAAICAGCSERLECRVNAGLRSEPDGCWGGAWFGEPFTADDFMRIGFPEPAAVEVEHGRGRYTAGCRCPRCAEANRLYVEAWRARGSVVTAAGRFEQTAIDWEVA